MRYKISIYNEVSGQKTIRYITKAGCIQKYVKSLWEETKQSAFDVVLIEKEWIMKQVEKQERQRKAGIQRGEVTQTMMSFRIDNDILEWLKNNTTNKGRFINNILRDIMVNSGGK